MDGMMPEVTLNFDLWYAICEEVSTHDGQVEAGSTMLAYWMLTFVHHTSCLEMNDDKTLLHSVLCHDKEMPQLYRGFTVVSH
jgi:hypothetical protein